MQTYGKEEFSFSSLRRREIIAYRGWGKVLSTKSEFDKGLIINENGVAPSKFLEKGPFGMSIAFEKPQMTEPIQLLLPSCLPAGEPFLAQGAALIGKGFGTILKDLGKVIEERLAEVIEEKTDNGGAAGTDAPLTMSLLDLSPLLTDQNLVVSKLPSDTLSPDIGERTDANTTSHLTIPAFGPPAPDHMKGMTDSPPLPMKIPQSGAPSPGEGSLTSAPPVVSEPSTPEARPSLAFEMPGVIPDLENLSQTPLPTDSGSLTGEPASPPLLNSHTISPEAMRVHPDLAEKEDRKENGEKDLQPEPGAGPVLQDKVPKSAPVEKRIFPFESLPQRDPTSGTFMSEGNEIPPYKAPKGAPSEMEIFSTETAQQEDLPSRIAISEKDDPLPSFSEARDGLERISSKEEARVFISEMDGHRQQDLHVAMGGDVKDQSSKAVTAGETGKGQPLHWTKTEDLEVDQQILKGVHWSLRNKEEKIKLTLEPPELGNIYLEVKRDKENIIAKLWTDNPEAKEILDMNKVHLSKMLKDDGFVLEKFDVLFSQDTRSFHDREKNFFHHPRWTEESAREDGTPSSGAPHGIDSIGEISIHRGSGYLDVLV